MIAFYIIKQKPQVVSTVAPLSLGYRFILAISSRGDKKAHHRRIDVPCTTVSVLVFGNQDPLGPFNLHAWIENVGSNGNLWCHEKETSTICTNVVLEFRTRPPSSTLVLSSHNQSYQGTKWLANKFGRIKKSNSSKRGDKDNKSCRI